jgi:hypothetical protein
MEAANTGTDTAADVRRFGARPRVGTVLTLKFTCNAQTTGVVRDTEKSMYLRILL